MANQTAPLPLPRLLIFLLLLISSQSANFLQPVHAAHWRIHIDDNLDESSRQWGQRSSTPPPPNDEEFDPPPDLWSVDLGQFQEEMMRRHSGPTFGFVKLRLGVPRTRVPNAVASDLPIQEEPPKEQIALKCQEADKGEAPISSSLPKEKGWLTEHCYNYQGFWYDNHFLRGVIWAQKNFEAWPTDTLLATFPKTGLTWLKALSFAIANRHNQDLPRCTLLTKNPHECVPYIEFYAYEKDPVLALDSLPSPRLLSTHIPYASLPGSVATSGCRIVCIVRNPKDVFVSMWSFISKIRIPDSDRPPISLEEAFGLFSKGVSLSGPFWDHVLGYWKASLEHPNKVLMLKYEDLKSETEPNVKRLASFLGCPFTPEEIEAGVVQEIINLCSIESLKQMEVNKSGVYRMGTQSRSVVENSGFFRRGEVGDWKNHLSQEMIERLDRITEQMFEGYDLKF